MALLEMVKCGDPAAEFDEGRRRLVTNTFVTMYSAAPRRLARRKFSVAV